METLKLHLMERRKDERVQVDYAASFSSERFKALGNIMDLSVAGCRVRSAFTFQQRNDVTVQIYVPRYERLYSVPTAVVRWSEDLDIGLEFVHLEPSSQRLLRDLIQALKAARAQSNRETGVRERDEHDETDIATEGERTVCNK